MIPVIGERAPPQRAPLILHGQANEQVILHTSENLARDRGLGMKLGLALRRLYPLHPWIIEVPAGQGIVIVRHPLLAKKHRKYRNLAYTVRLRDLGTDGRIADKAKSAGGVLLEYFNVSRGAFRGLDGSAPAFTTLPHLRIA